MGFCCTDCAVIIEDGTNNESNLNKRGTEKNSRWIMKENTSNRNKTLGWAAIAYAAFTAISVIGPIILERFWSRRQ